MMYRLLIVDDEPVIVDGMFELFQEQYMSNLEVYRAYSGKEALKLMEGMRIDIVISDIGMPKIDGFQLQKETGRLWPHSKFIFLTSHNDFHYAQTAIRNGSADFILKTEEDDKIIAGVRKALVSLEEDQGYKDLIERAKKQMHLALPLLRKDYLTSIHDGTVPRHMISAAAFQDMQVSMDVSANVLPVIGRIDDWGHYESKSDRALMTHAVENILAEFFNHHNFQFAAVDKSYFAVFVQPADDGQESDEDAAERRWERVITFVKGILEAVQPVIGRLLKLSVSFSIGHQPVIWHELHLHFESLRKLLMRIPGNEMILTAEMSLHGAEKTNTNHHHRVARNLLQKIADIEFSSAAQHEQFADMISRLKECLDASYDPSLFTEIYFSIASNLISFMNRWETNTITLKMTMFEQFEVNRPYTHVLDEFIRIAAALIREKEIEQCQHTHQVVHILQQYIEENIDKELSLNRLSEIVYLNPVYLSRLYKQSTGTGLVDYINEVRLKKAKQALIETNAKIHDIARSVGFESPTYFARLFKRNEGMTPQEYREKRPL
ncbi:response regulator [Paenibacillus sp. GCM10027626]|uniref:response regulator transcription factor n=1 Tax=Paenibacillus sp. GCM10027626 TaxID=3273411 RepID=UPI00362A2F9B